MLRVVDDSPWGEHYEAPKERKPARARKPPRDARDASGRIRTRYGALDLPIVIFAFALQILVILCVAVMALFSAFIGDACGEHSCDFGLMAAAGWTAVIGPWVVFAGSVLLAGRRRLRGRTAWWIPLLGIAAIVVVAIISQVMLYAGADQLV